MGLGISLSSYPPYLKVFLGGLESMMNIRSLLLTTDYCLLILIMYTRYWNYFLLYLACQ